MLALTAFQAANTPLALSVMPDIDAGPQGFKYGPNSLLQSARPWLVLPPAANNRNLHMSPSSCK